MKTASILMAVTRVIGPILILLGILFWTGTAYQLLTLHIGLGFLLVLILWAMAVLAMRAGANRGMVAFAIAWGVLMPWFGMTRPESLGDSCSPLGGRPGGHGAG